MEYVVSFYFPQDGVFLRCDHGLDFESSNNVVCRELSHVLAQFTIDIGILRRAGFIAARWSSTLILQHISTFIMGKQQTALIIRHSIIFT